MQGFYQINMRIGQAEAAASRGFLQCEIEKRRGLAGTRLANR